MTPKITIYGSKMDTCTQRVLILLEELHLSYKLQEIDLASGEQHSKQVLRYRESEDSDERILYESRCILRFLSNKHDTEIDYYPDSNCDMWLEIESQHLNQQLSKIVKMQSDYEVDDQIIESVLNDLDKVLSIYEKNLNKSKSKFLSGDTFTIADIACIPYLNYFVKCQRKDYLKQYSKFYHWFKKVKSRESVKKIIG